MIGLITRCKDEYFIKEFCDYYLNQGIDSIYVIDDDSNDKSIYEEIKDNAKISILFDKNIIHKGSIHSLYKKIRLSYEWMIYVDVDEFITTKKHLNRTIKEELEITFKKADCIKIPWVMMSCNSIEKSPKSILETNTTRWNHDLKHPNETYRKFRCRYKSIESKSIFRPLYFESIRDHIPLHPTKKVKAYNGVTNKKMNIQSFHSNLREKDIHNGYLLCYHYRIISKENCINKIKNNEFYSKYQPEELLATDYNEIYDETLKIKASKYRGQLT